MALLKGESAQHRSNRRTLCCRLVAVALLMSSHGVHAAPKQAAGSRLKDLVNIRGVRTNFLSGFGLVAGLKGTGDSKKSLTTNRAIAHMLTRMGLKTSADEVVTGAMAAVLVTAELPPFARAGDPLDIKVSTVGDARSLAGGTLVLTPLSAGNGEVFAMAQGAVVVGQATGNGPQVLSVARVPRGAMVEREFRPTLAQSGTLTLSLKDPDFTTAARIAEALNQEFRGFYAEPKDLASVEVRLPPAYQGRLVDFIAAVEGVRVVADHRATVVVNERTGTVAMGAKVMIAPVAIAHGDLAIRVGDAKGSGAKGSANKQTVIAIGKGDSGGGTSVGELVETMNQIGVKPADLIGILQALHAAGALNAELKFL